MTGAAAGSSGSGSSRRAAVGKAGGRSRSAQPRAAGGGGGGSGGGSEEEEQRDGGSLFLVNKSGFPLDGQTWERMWGHVERVHPDGGAVAAAIRSAPRLARVRRSPGPCLKKSEGATKPQPRHPPAAEFCGRRGGGEPRGLGRRGSRLSPEDALGPCEGQLGENERPRLKMHKPGTGACAAGCLGAGVGVLGKKQKENYCFVLGRKKWKTGIKRNLQGLSEALCAI